MEDRPVAVSYEKIHSISRLAGANYTAAAPEGAEYRFAVINPDPVTGANPDSPGLYGGSAEITVPCGNVIVNTSAGADCFGVFGGKAIFGDPIEVIFGGRCVVIAGGTIAIGDLVSSDDTGAAVAQSGEAVILGTALSAAVAGEQLDILFNSPGG